MSAGRRGGTATELLSLDVSELLATRTWSTGFELLDACLGGGLRGGELTVLGGAPGVGKTTLALQIARNIAAGGGRVSYVCYEHTGQELLTRLLLMEAGLGYPDELPVARPARGAHSAPAALDRRLEYAIDTVGAYGDRLRLVRGDSSPDAELDPAIADGEPPAVLVVDYLQKVPSRIGGDAVEAERVTEVVERLKDHAMEHSVPVIAIVASDRSGLESARVRVQDLRGSTAVAYEADVALLLNEKNRVVARHHLVYAAGDTTKFQDQVVCTIEKNRSGRANVDLELRKRFSHGCFAPEATTVAERLVDGRVYVD
jgi:replicative DNA helicase